MHCEKRRRRVWRSEILLVMEEISRSTALIRDLKKEEANEAEPTGWPSRRKPDVSSTGMAGRDLSVGWGEVEKEAIVMASEEARVGLWADRRGRMEEPSHDERMRVFEGLTKHPILAPRRLSSVQRNSRSGRYTQDEMLST
jgi:hypothetical protein